VKLLIFIYLEVIICWSCRGTDLNISYIFAGHCKETCQSCTLWSSKEKRNEILRLEEDWSRGEETFSWWHYSYSFVSWFPSDQSQLLAWTTTFNQRRWRYFCQHLVWEVMNIYPWTLFSSIVWRNILFILPFKERSYRKLFFIFLFLFFLLCSDAFTETFSCKAMRNLTINGRGLDRGMPWETSSVGIVWWLNDIWY
jgi:hypothetical protein